MDFEIYKLIMASWGLVGAACSAGLYLRALVRERRVAARVVAGRN